MVFAQGFCFVFEILEINFCFLIHKCLYLHLKKDSLLCSPPVAGAFTSKLLQKKPVGLQIEGALRLCFKKWPVFVVATKSGKVGRRFVCGHVPFPRKRILK